uniref:Uncharacterized protein LOC114343359 n=1 Tax=Diabrotica virgifera virgifera TaxID=50390 RepID=A0A6P7GX39_DIAVI
MKEAKHASKNINQNINVCKEYRRLSENVMALVILLNRKRIGEIQYLKIKTYGENQTNSYQSEFVEALTETEKILAKTFKRVVTGGKGSKPVAILFPPDIQKLINVMLKVRKDCVPDTNEYLFANPKNDRWLSGYHVLKKLADQSGVQHKELFTSTRLRKQIACVLQVLNVTETEMEQFASFMGHTKKTHEEYYRLPQDIYQTAKVSKLLMAINKGHANKYKEKRLDEIQLSDEVDSEEEEGINAISHNDKRASRLRVTSTITSAQSKSICTDSIYSEPENDTLASRPGLTSTITAVQTKSNTSDSSSSEPENNIENSQTNIGNQKQRLNSPTQNSTYAPSTSNISSSSTEIESDNKKTTKKRKLKTSATHTVISEKSVDGRRKKKIVRERWTEEQKQVVIEHFHRHIKDKVSPKKAEVEEFLKQYKTIFIGRNWVCVKAFVYNVYRKT